MELLEEQKRRILEEEQQSLAQVTFPAEAPPAQRASLGVPKTMRRFLLNTLLSPPGWSQRPAQQLPHRVQIMVDGDKQGATLIKSYANRELRELGDVVVENDEPTHSQHSTEYHLGFVVLPITGGYAISIVAEDLNTTERELKSTLEIRKIDPLTISLALNDVQDSSIVKSHWLRTCHSSALEAGIKAVVAKFDVEFLQPSRDFWRKTQKYRETQ